MAVNLKQSDAAIKRIGLRAEQYAKIAALYFLRALRRTLQISNRKGEEPSKPGESPRRSQFGWLLQNVVIERVGKHAFRVGVRKAAKYGIWLELGTGPFVVTARPGKKLRIWLRSSVVKSLGADGLKRLGAKKMTDPKDGRTKWAIFRSRVKHPGIRPRPFFRPTLKREGPTVRKIMAQATTR